MVYNLTGIASSPSYLGFIQGVNSELMNNLYGILILIAVGAIAFIGFLTYNPNPRPALIGASFIVFIASMGLKIASLVPDLAIFITLGLLGLSIAIGSGNR